MVLKKLLPLALLVCALAACDSSPVGPDPVDDTPLPTPGAEVRVTAQIPVFSVDVEGAAHVVLLPSHFEGNEAAGALTYSVEAGAAVAAVVSGDTLTVRPTEPGTTEVRVTARGERGGEARSTFVAAVTDDVPRVRLGTPLPDRTFYEDGTGGNLLLSSPTYFRGNTAAGPLSFSIEVEGSAVDVYLSSGFLVMTPVELGPTEIRVTARGQHGGEVTAVMVATTRECPVPAQGLSTSDYLPLADGETWQFRYRSQQAVSSPTHFTETLGTLAWTLAPGSTCMGAFRRYTLVEAMDGVRTSTLGPTPTSTPVSWTREQNIEVFSDDIRVPYWPHPHERVPRYGAANELLFQALPVTGGPGCVTPDYCPLNSDWRVDGHVRLQMIRGQGINSREYFASLGSAGWFRESITRLSN